MTWWQTLLTSSVPVLLTLIITNVAEWKRRQTDTAERERDRAADAAKQDNQRAEQIADHWRQKRHDAHKHMLLILDDEISRIVKFIMKAQDDFTRGTTVPGTPIARGVMVMPAERHTELRDAFVEVKILATDESREKCRHAVELLTFMHGKLEGRDGDDIEELSEITGKITPLVEYRRQYEESVRAEIGTSIAI